MQHVSVDLNEDNHRALYVPERFAHGYQVLADKTETSYQVGEFYSPANERALRWDDPMLGLEWPIEMTVISEKDRVAPEESREPAFQFCLFHRSGHVMHNLVRFRF